jgi:hypothetical protein
LTIGEGIVELENKKTNEFMLAGIIRRIKWWDKKRGYIWTKEHTFTGRTFKYTLPEIEIGNLL